MSDTNTSRTSIKDNESFVFFVSRAHKLTSAVYLVTDLFDVREPLRWSLRNGVLNVVSSVASMLTSSTPSSRSFVSVKRTIEEVLFMIETAGRSRLVSRMNRDILFREIQSFVADLDEFVRETGSTGARTLENIFQRDVSIPKLPERSEDRFYSNQSKGHDKGHISAPRSASKIPPATAIEKTQSSKGQSNQTNGSSSVDRREKIVAILKEKGPVTIKDISSGIPGCSDKTIQRDLVDMVASGVVKKEGERRWTTYFL